MSYYSDVKCVMYKKDWEKIRKQILENTEIDEYGKYLFEKPSAIVDKDDIVIVCWDSVNHWDECTNECIEMFMDYLRNDDVYYKYIRVGEGYDNQTDIETLSNYPDDFDIVVLRDKVAVKVRDRMVVGIGSLDEYGYSDVPVINGRGFAVKIADEKDLKAFLSELNAQNGNISSEFFNKWITFETYRKIVFKDEIWN